MLTARFGPDDRINGIAARLAALDLAEAAERVTTAATLEELGQV